MIQIHHETLYSYSRPVFLSPQIFRLKPSAHHCATIKDYKLLLEPGIHELHWIQDAFGNSIARAIFPDLVNYLKVDVSFCIEPVDFDPFSFYLDIEASNYPFEYNLQTRKALCAYFDRENPGPLLTSFIKSSSAEKTPITQFLVAINNRIFNEIRYTQRDEPGIQTCEETLSGKLGSCRDTAWLLVQVLRHLKLASRFVSGYLVETGAEIAERVSLHAWAEVFLPGAGWIGLDPTSGLLTGMSHIPLACSSIPESAAPVSGMVGECESTISFQGSIRRI